MKNKFKITISLFLMLILLSSTIYAASLPNRVIPYNSRGQDVVEVQKALNSLGAGLKADGIYGKGTKDAVRDFQSKYKSLSNDGIYGPSTKVLLEKALNTPPEASVPYVTLTLTDKGPDVMKVQKALNNIGFHIVLDGIYGETTKEAVRSFQERYSSLTNDGVYGPSTGVILEQALRDAGNNVVKPDKPSEKIAYLTFDDGPSANVTPRILETLNAYGVKATFFMLGNMAEKNPGVLRSVHANGHSIGNHTYSHDYKYIYADLDNFLGEVYKTDEIFKEVLGDDFHTKLLRFPGGSFGANKAVYKDTMTKLRYKIYDWNALNGDSEGKDNSYAGLMKRFKETVKDKDRVVILMHDSTAKSTTADTLPEVLDYLIKEGYEFRQLLQ